MEPSRDPDPAPAGAGVAADAPPSASSAEAAAWRRTVRAAAIAAAFVAGYVLLDRVSYIHPVQQFNITPWNPQPALAIALVMTLGQRWLPVVLAAALLAERVVRGDLISMPASALAAAVLTLGYAAIARALTGHFSVSFRLDTRRDILRLAGVVVVGSLATGLLYVAALLATGTGPRSAPVAAVVGFWIGDAIGILVTLPLLLMLLDPARRRQLGRLLAGGELLAQCAAIVAVVWALFGWAAPDQFKYFYALFLPIVWVAARTGMAGVAVAAVVMQGCVILAVSLVGYQTLTVFELQALLMALTFTGYFVGVTVDERRRAAEELKRTLGLAVAGEMSAAIAHELNQPLLAVSAYAKASKLLADAPGTDRERLAQTLDKLAAEAKRAGDVVRRLRELFRVGAAQPVETDPREPIGRAVESMRARAEAANVVLGYAERGTIPALRLDPLQIEVVVQNLVHNAIDAVAQTRSPGAVSVELARGGDGGIAVSVADTGPGIAAEDAERLFEPLTTTKAQGMGMGLTISRAIVEAHGGRLWIEPGRRGLVRFSLPPRGARG
ncbi:MAG: MASE1 domain-containing protein [Burkholderiales bacterium]